MRRTVDIKIIGENFDESLKYSLDYVKNSSLFVHPFDDFDIVLGQSTICHEILEDIQPEYIISCVYISSWHWFLCKFI